MDNECRLVDCDIDDFYIKCCVSDDCEGDIFCDENVCISPGDPPLTLAWTGDGESVHGINDLISARVFS